MKTDDKIKLIKSKNVSNKGLDVLVNDKNWIVRAAVAECYKDKYLDILVKDKDCNVRVAVSGHGRDKDLDILISNKD